VDMYCLDPEENCQIFRNVGDYLSIDMTQHRRRSVP